MKEVTIAAPKRLDALQARFARRVIARLEEAPTPSDVGERLRFARERALQRAREVNRAAAAPRRHVGGGTLALGGGDVPWWVRLAAVLPLVLLLGGLTLIQERRSLAQIEAVAEIDAAILADNLPPWAYSDPGFAEYLKVVE